MNALTFGELFAGIGGFGLGFERAGMRCVWQSEIDPYCQRVLEKHWPDVLRVPDVRDVGRDTVPWVDVICGGPPCQPTSNAGEGLGEADERWMWPDTLRVLGELRPRYAVLENPPAFLRRGMLGVLGGLAEIGYDAEWSVVSACALGAPHARERLFILAYPESMGQHGRRGSGPRPPLLELERCGSQPRWPGTDQPRPVGVAYGLPGRVDRLRALGNAVVPQVAELIGRRIVAFEAERGAVAA